MQIVIIDDKTSFLESFETKYVNDERAIETFQSLEEALPYMKDNFYNLDFVILDGKGYRQKDETGQGDELFATDAREAIDNLIREKKQDLPYCYYTAYTDDKTIDNLKSKTYLGTSENIKVFKKVDSGTKDLFAFVEHKVKQKEDTSIKQQYLDIFEIFNLGYLDNSVERDLINTMLLLKNLTDDNSKQLSRNIRPIMETVLNKVAVLDKKYTGAHLRNGDEQSLSSAIWFLAGKPTWNKSKRSIEYSGEIFLPLHRYEIFSSLNKSTSTSSMHDYNHPISDYLARSYLNSLLDLLLWFKSLNQNI
jgi:response regulator RpfG family c-di-GMP phosphodiesterase